MCQTAEIISKDGIMDVRSFLPSRPGGPTDPDRWVDSGPPRFPLAGKVVAAALVPLGTLGWVRHEGLDASTAITLVAVAVAVGTALGVLARWPVATLAITLAGSLTTVLVYQMNPIMVLALQVAVFGVAALQTRTVALIAAAVTAIMLFCLTWASARGPATDARVIIGVVLTGFSFASGRAVRGHRALVAALADRARRADETREQEARARVAEERVRIARELHDVVAHHIAVINVHAGLARKAQGRSPEMLDSSLTHVQDAAHTVLEELGTVLHVLRSGGGDDVELAPTSGLDRLDDLLATMASTGFEVRLRREGRPRPMDAACDLAAFRIIQESLTNASKHGWGDQADLTLAYDESELRIEVRNATNQDSGPSRGTGQGLIGMHERAKACGGTLSTRLDADGIFRVDAMIPNHPRRGQS
ncbi:signal transduction histidine kinase [Kribbella antiqua]|uniref:histidine kinase n=1 Tax=Kribbella antiqua TaxID=2512217 RepID=A0A4R2IW08_9ACTN|nr:signal transduction histidine kinase [Kribbella antiqua]